jgi:hypothetical protein
MENHIERLEELLSYALEEIKSKQVIEVMGAKLHVLVDFKVLCRDIQNFVSYLQFVLSAPIVPKVLKLDLQLVRFFIDRTYVGFDPMIQDIRVQKLYGYLQDKLGDNAPINDKSFAILEKTLKAECKPTFENLKEYILLALLLKWFNTGLKDKLSKTLDDYVIYCATVFGQLQSDRILNIEYETPEISESDQAVLAMEYTFFETALNDAIKKVKQGAGLRKKGQPLKQQMRIVFVCLDRLINADKVKADEIAVFRDKLIVSTALIYLQDEFVVKDPEVQDLVKLFVSLYYQFRDKRSSEKTK